MPRCLLLVAALALWPLAAGAQFNQTMLAAGAAQPPSSGGVTYLQSAGGQAAIPPNFGATAMLATATDGPYCLVVTVPYSAGDVTSVTDSTGDSFTGPVVASNTSVAVYYATGLVNSPASVSAAFTDNPGSGIITVDEYGNCAGVDGTPSVAIPSGTTVTTSTETAAHSGDMIWSGFVTSGSGETWTPGSGFAGRMSSPSGAQNAQPCAYNSSTCDFFMLSEDMATNAGTVSASATQSSGVAAWAAIVVLAPPPPCGATSLNLTNRCNLVLVSAVLH